MVASESGPIRVGIDSRLRSWAPEVKYALRTLLLIAGYPHVMRWVGDGDRGDVDLYYGPRPSADRGRNAVNSTDAMVSIEWCGLGFDWATLSRREPTAVSRDEDGTPHLFFGERGATPLRRSGARLELHADAVFAAYWLLTGAREAALPRDRDDNLDVGASSLHSHGLLDRATVSRYARLLREHFEAAGRVARRPGWSPAPGRAAFALTHDVDYPEIRQGVERLRWLLRRGLEPVPAAFRDRDAYWRFADWVDFARTHDTRPAFYFMARRGSLVRFAMGDRDAFYEIGSPRFRSLFDELRGEGCEIGLHASFRSCEQPERFVAERDRLAELSRSEVAGNRHHYWRLAADAPHDTLREHERAGLVYDSSLAFEMHPGFRRGVCQPFRPFHPVERRCLDLVELPPTWMDDHYDGRLSASGIEDPEEHAASLLGEVAECGGVAVLDYHVRGMNAEMFPRWGQWLRDLLARRLPTGMRGGVPSELVREYVAFETQLLAASVDEAEEAA